MYITTGPCSPTHTVPIGTPRLFSDFFSKARQWPSCYDFYGSFFTLRRHSALTKLKMVTFQKKEKNWCGFFSFNMYGLLNYLKKNSGFFCSLSEFYHLIINE